MTTHDNAHTDTKHAPSSRDGDAAGGGDSSGAGNILAGEQEETSDHDKAGGPKRNETPSSPDARGA